MKTTTIAPWLTLLAAAALPAQVATYSPIGRSCANQLNVDVELESSKPVLGTVMTVNVAGRAGARGFLNFSPRWHLSGLDLSAAGMPGCRMYVKPEFGITLPLTWPANSKQTSVSFYLPTSAPKGIFYVNQAFAVLPGANASGLVTSNAGLGRTGTAPDLTTQEIAAFAPLVKLHPIHTRTPIDPLYYISTCQLRRDDIGSNPAYNKVTKRWENIAFGWEREEILDIPLSFINSFGLHSGGKNRRPHDANRGSRWNVYLNTHGFPPGPRDPNGESPMFTYYRRVGDYDHQIQYWFLMARCTQAGKRREGQWQHVTVHVRFGRVLGAFFSTNVGEGNYYTASRMQFSGTHPVVFLSGQAHHNYPAEGTYDGYECKDGGVQWKSWLKLERLSAQPWRDFAGAWGDIGFNSATTGDLGPWHRRNGK